MRKTKKKQTQESVALNYGFRSGLEETVAKQIWANEKTVCYEEVKVQYTVPESTHVYTPDFILSNGIVVETKGRFVLADRKKHLLVKGQHPGMDIRFVFSNPDAPIRKGAKSTYSDWCNKHGFQYAKKVIPRSWFLEI